MVYAAKAKPLKLKQKAEQRLLLQNVAPVTANGCSVEGDGAVEAGDAHGKQTQSQTQTA